jgi:hypothetical protein
MTQIEFIKNLCNEREVPEANRQLMAEIQSGARAYSKKRLSDCIGWLLTLPRVQGRESSGGQIDPNLVPGVYEINGQVFIVRKSKRDKTRLVGYSLQETGSGVVRATEAGNRVHSFEYKWSPGAVYRIKLTDRMPVERAKELVMLYGRCIACGIKLKAASSVEKGIGPVCIKKFGPVLNPVAETVDGRTVEVRAA